MASPNTALPPSLWAATAEPAPDCPPLVGRAEAEVAIVGGGFTGLSAALHLAEAGTSVCLLEAAEPGWGASGRNGGQVNPAWKILPREMRARFGEARADGVIRMADATCDLVFALIERHGIACDAVRPGYIQGAIGGRAKDTIARWVEDWSAEDAPVELLDRQGVADLIGTEAYDCALLDRRGGNLQPLCYARGLARAAQAAGATLHGLSPAQAIEKDGAGWRVSCGEGSQRGEVRARWVLLCTNGYSDALWPGLAQSVVPVMSLIAATKPLGGNLREGILPGRHAVSEALRAMVYYRLDRDRRFVIGGRSPWGLPNESADVEHVRRAAIRLYPQLAGAEWDFSWGGFVALTRSHAPLLMRLAPGVLAGLGYNGRGVAMATMMGKQLAAAVTGAEIDMPVQAMERFPLHGFRQIGVSGGTILGAWLDRLDALARR